MLKNLIVALAAVTLLGGCFKIDKTPPKDLPAYVHIYPGSTTVMSMNVAGLQSVVVQTTDKPDDVVTYYRTQASTDGLQETTMPAQAGATADQRQASFTDATGKMLVVMAKPQGTETMVTIMYQLAPKASS